MLKNAFAGLLLAAALAAPLGAAGDDTLAIRDAYVRATPPGQSNTAAYMTLHNGGATDVALTGAETAAARATELHTVVHENGMMKMRRVAKIEIKAGSDTRLQPGGLHVMLIGVKQPLREGTHVELALHFSDGSMRRVTAPVRTVAGAAKGGMHSHGGH